MLLYQLVLILAVFTFQSASTTKKGTDTLVLLHVLFRHGHRTSADVSLLYNTDPHKDNHFYPYGKGELTNIGKRTEYSIGQKLRNKYDKFLGKTYTSDILYAQSTAFNRTKTSLQLVLASLFPPRYNQIWNLLLFNWQPIPYNYNPLHNDPLLFPTKSAPFIKYLNEYRSSPEYSSLKGKYQYLFDYVSENVGSKMESFQNLYYIYDTFKTQEELGLALPEWAKSIYPDPMQYTPNLCYNVYTATTDLKRAVTGCLLSKIVHDTQNKINGSEYLKNTKLFLYSAHDINLVTLLITLGFDYGVMPPYGSYIVFEIHRLNDADYGIQMFYQNYTKAEPALLTIPGCSNPCPLDDFVELTQEYYPEPEQCISI